MTASPHRRIRSACIETLEARQLLAADFSAKINFQPSGVPVPSGYVADTGATYGNRNGLTYGWSTTVSGAARDRNAPNSADQRYDTLLHSQKSGSARWDIAVPNGEYDVRLVAGDAAYHDSVFRFNIENSLALAGTPTSGSRWVEATVRVSVSDGKLTITNASGASNNKLNFVEITSAGDSQPAPSPSPSPELFSADINFQPSGAAVPAGYFSDVGLTFGNRNGLSYGWTRNVGGESRDRNSSLSADQRFDTLHHMQKGGSATWEIAVPSGAYDITLAAGDAGYFDSVFRISVEGTLAISGTPTSSKRWFENTVRVNVTDGKLTIANASGASNNKINFVSIRQISATTTPAPTPVPEPTGPVKWPTSFSRKADAPVDRFESYGFSYKGKVYVMGGFSNDNFQGTSRVDVYDVAANKWTRLSDMPAPFSHSGFAFDGQTGTAYFISGYRGVYPSYTVNDFWKYEVDEDRWTKLGETPFEGGAASAALVDGQLHYIGGVTHIRDQTTNWHWTYDLNNPDAGWVRLANAPVARDHAASVVLNGEIYIVGGEVGHDNNPTQHKTLYKYNVASSTWTRLADAPISRSHNEASTFTWNGKIVSVGGQTHGQVASRSVCVYDPATNKWTTVANFVTPLQGAVAQRVGNQIVVTGGANPTPSEQHRWTYVGNIPI